MLVSDVIKILEEFAPLSLQESYDNSGLLIGSKNSTITGILLTIDITEDVVNEAIENNCNFIISHHPLIFKPLKRIVGENETQRCILKLIKNDIAVYAAHTNFDNVIEGVNAKIADRIGLTNRSVLLPMSDNLLKLITYVPKLHAVSVRDAIFEAGAGNIGNYDSCSFSVEGFGTFKANDLAQPFVGEANKLHTEPEIKLEVILPEYTKLKVLNALLKSHPYEEPAYDLIPLQNTSNRLGAGLVGDLENEMDELEFLNKLKELFNCKTIRHTNLLTKKIKRVALCGGSGSFLLKNAILSGADIFISGDFKYHEFFDAENRILIADLGHFETEQYTKHIFYELITEKMPTFAVRISETKTNPINYL
jgi:dinuclear metal center YbgI/SA1388 family protein